MTDRGPAKPVELDEAAIQKRAYEISQRADGGSPEENWRRAREELFDEGWLADNERSAGEPHPDDAGLS